MSSTIILLWASALLGLTLASFITYQVKFHPLARYPGPFFAKLTNAYGAYHAWKEDVHIEMWRCHQVYGDFVRWGPDRIIVNNAAGLKDIYASGKNVIKSQGYNALVHRVPSVIAIRDKKEASNRRRLIGEGLSDTALRGHEPVMLSRINRLCDVLAPSHGAWSEPRNMANWSSYIAFDVMADVIFGQKYDLIGSPTHRYIVGAINGSNIRTTVLGYLPQLMWHRLDKKLLATSIKARNKFLVFMTKLLQARFQVTCDDRKDVFSVLLKVPDDETEKLLHDFRIRADSATLAIAATDTVATAMASVFFYLSRYPDSYRRARDEVRQAFSSREQIRTGPTLNSCTYLRACIDESMRITAPAGGAPFREVAPGGAIVDGHHFPAGADVGTSIYAIHQNPEYFPRPHRFDPERWLVKDGDVAGRERLQRMYSVFNPFSIGPRSCVGKGMAMIEMMLTMGTVLWEFDSKMVDGPDAEVGGGNPFNGPVGRRNPDEYQLYHGGITSNKTGPILQFRHRQAEMTEGKVDAAISMNA